MSAGENIFKRLSSRGGTKRRRRQAAKAAPKSHTSSFPMEAQTWGDGPPHPPAAWSPHSLGARAAAASTVPLSAGPSPTVGGFRTCSRDKFGQNRAGSPGTLVRPTWLNHGDTAGQAGGCVQPSTGYGAAGISQDGAAVTVDAGMQPRMQAGQGGSACPLPGCCLPAACPLPARCLPAHAH